MSRNRMKKILLFCIALGVLCAPRLLLAHEIGPDQEGPEDWDQLWRSWGLEPGTLIDMSLSALLYGIGLWRTWRASGVGHGIRRWEAACFWSGWLALFIALVSPLHPLGEVLFSAHMAQHELLMLVAAPLLVLGRPMIGFLRALPAAWSARLGRFSNTHGWRIAWGFVSAPLVAWIVHAIVLWGWHAPVLFQATLHSEWVHAAQHISFLASALLFWWALIHGHRGVTNYGVAVFYLFTTAIHSGLLGALLTFARTVWYPDYSNTQVWGLTPLEDQQIGGLIMWVPACSVYIIAGLAMFAQWLRQSEQRVVHREQGMSLKLQSVLEERSV
jgi:putative membrane protein